MVSGESRNRRRPKVGAGQDGHICGRFSQSAPGGAVAGRIHAPSLGAIPRGLCRRRPAAEDPAPFRPGDADDDPALSKPLQGAGAGQLSGARRPARPLDSLSENNDHEPSPRSPVPISPARPSSARSSGPVHSIPRGNAPLDPEQGWRLEFQPFQHDVEYHGSSGGRTSARISLSDKRV